MIREGAPGRIRYWVVIAAGLVLLLWSNYYLRSTLESADVFLFDFYRYFYPGPANVIFSPDYPKWRLLLPISSMTGSWSPTILVLTHFVTGWIGLARTWYLANALLILVSFAASWSVFRSRVFAFTLAIAMGFGTHLYYTYPNSGTIGFPLLFVYYELLLLCVYRVITASTHRLLWKIAFGVALIVTALGYETWLDFLVFTWLAAAVVAWLLWRQGDGERLRRLGAVLVAMTAVGIAYVYIKVNHGYGQQPGMETDLVFNYPYLAPAIEDVVSNIFMNFYMTATIFLPPMFVTSTAFYQLGGDGLVNLQHGYHAPFTYLVPMQAMFMWRYFAGVLATIFVYCGVRTLKATSRAASFEHVAALVFMIMVATGGPTHMFIKARPFNSMAVQTYHVMTALLGMSLLVSLILTLAWRRWPRLWPGGVLIAAGWTVMFYSALARPGMISHEAAQSGLGVQIYPNPMTALMTRLGWRHTAPAGLTLYQLMKYSPSAVPAAAPATAAAPAVPETRRFQGGAGPLPILAPPISRWGHPPQVSVTVDKERGWVVNGDATPMGYELTSPPLPVPPNRTVLVRVEGTIEQGRVCVGALDETQARWLVAAAAARQEIAVDTGNNHSVTIVIANCMDATPSPVPTRFVLESVSYAVLTPAQEIRP